MATVADRGLLVSLLDVTGEGPVTRGNLQASVRITGEALDLFLYGLILDGLISERDGLIDASPGQRLGIAVRAMELGADFERVCRALGWLEFEEMAAHVFEENGYAVRRRYRFRAEGRRWEIDVLASRRPFIVCAECKHWTRGMGNAAARRTVEVHLEKARVFSGNVIRVADKLGLRAWSEAVVVPIVLSLTRPPMRFHQRVPVVSILELPRFISEFECHLDRLIRFTVELRPQRSRPSQTILRAR